MTQTMTEYTAMALTALAGHLKAEETMTDVDAILLIEGGDASEEVYVAAFQHLINAGVVWRLQGFYGRTATALLEAGLCSRPGAS